MAVLDQIPAPAADAVTFRVARWRLLLAVVSFLAVFVMAARAITVAMSGRGEIDLAGFLGSAGLMSLATGVGFVVGIRNLGWVRVSSAGLEFAGTGRAPMFLPWSAVGAVGRRRVWPFTRLIITPTDPQAVSVVMESAPIPKPRRRDGSYSVDIALIRPGPKELLAELQRRRGSRTS